MADFPSDFKTIPDINGHPLGGFGGNPAKDRAYHRDFIRKSGKAPVVLVHGNTGTATHPQWGWLKVINELKRNEFGYTDEHFWALSYLKSGEREIKDAYTSNVEDLRRFTDYVRDYLEVNCIDMVGHSLGCFLIMCYLSGLKSQSDPIVWDQGKRHANVGTIVLLDGAMKGLSQFSQPFYSQDMYDEWLGTHAIYDCLSPDNTPYGTGDDMTVSPPRPHHVKYWCCMVPGGYVDQMDNFKGRTGHLDGADQNRNYNVGSGVLSHEKVKDEPAIIRDWAVYLNAVPPMDPVTITVNHPSGDYGSDLSVSVSFDPITAGPVCYTANRVTKKIIAGHIETAIAESIEGHLADGQILTFATQGMWALAFQADGAGKIFRTYWVGISSPKADILTDNSVPFNQNLQVQAVTDKGIVYMNNGGSDAYGWVATSTVSISDTIVVKAIAITSDGITSEIITRKFEAAIKEQAHGTVTKHYIDGRLDVNGYIHYGSKYGYMQAFTLYKIDGKWTDAPDTSAADIIVPVVTCSHQSGTYLEPIKVCLTATDNDDPAPLIFYSTDGSTPTPGSSSFVNRGMLNFNSPGQKTLKYFATDRSGNSTEVETRIFGMEIENVQPFITTDVDSTYHNSSVTVTLTAFDNIDPDVTVYYTEDGSIPNTYSPFFINSKEFFLSENRNHAISCYAKDSSDNENRTIFHYVIQDTVAPETRIFPSGGAFVEDIQVSMTTNEPVEWIKYTTDGSTPDESNGTFYQQAFALSDTTTVKFRSKDTQGNMEDIKSVDFVRQTGPRKMTFENMADIDGYIKATPEDDYRSVVSEVHLAVGAGWDGRISRAIVSFDTANIPQGATITRAYLQVKYHSGYGNPWENATLKIDVKTGKFGTDVLCQTEDWDETPTAKGVAHFEPFGFGCKDSTDFNAEGRNAINKTGRTQMRLYFDPHDDMDIFNYVFLEKGNDVRLFVEY
ncbi:MAG: alpha/beta fold hydrolase [Proteobacteria bacterium]|nr:alpha/beta fold hydrolase [Pseudomonadota bacterium]